MADRPDDVDAWLKERIEPLPPPPGTFELIKRRARRRKYRKLAITATSAALIVAAAVTVPQVVNLPVLSPHPTSSAAAGQSSPVTPTGGGHAESSAAASLPQAKASSSVPANFQPASVTFVGVNTGWVIGQAGTPDRCATRYCTSLARTDNAGRTWTGVPAPVVGPADGATGVSQVRFLNLDDGWAFGPELFATHDGGQTWAHIGTGGLRVTDLETVGHRVFALWAACAGTGSSFASQCVSYTLYSAPASGGAWTPVGAATTGLAGGAGQTASLVLTGTIGYLLAPDGALYAGPVDGSAAWRRVSPVPAACDARATGPDAQPGGAQPGGALLGAVNASELILACVTPNGYGNGRGPAEQKQIFSSLNGGASWRQMAGAPALGNATSLAASPLDSVILATDRGIDLRPKGETTWQKATFKEAAPADGFSYVGMTTGEQGIALPADPASGTVWFTFDGGQTWAPSPVTS